MSRSILEKVSTYKSVIWDWNGTLLNDATIGSAAENEIFNRYGLPTQTLDERQQNFFMPIEKYYEKMGFDFSKVSYEKVALEWLEVYESLVKEAPLFHGILEILTTLHEQKINQYVLSAAPELHLLEMIQKHSISHFFNAVYGLRDANARSKIARGFDLVKEQNIEASTAILIGDTLHDFEVGKALGTDILLVADGHQSFESLKGTHPNLLMTRY